MAVFSPFLCLPFHGSMVPRGPALRFSVRNSEAGAPPLNIISRHSCPSL
jgi:hypothetical protein